MIEQLKQLLNLKLQRLLGKSHNAIRQVNFPYGNFGQTSFDTSNVLGSLSSSNVPPNIPFNRFPY